MNPEDILSRRAGDPLRQGTGYWGIDELAELKILTEATGQDRNRVWLAREIMTVVGGEKPARRPRK